MPVLSYERYGLTGNPFRDLISENLEDVEAFHVNLEVDRTLQIIKEEVLAKENRATVALVGAIGSGKTERLRVAAAESKREGALTISVDVSPQPGATWKEIGAEIEKTAVVGGFARLFSAPGWYRAVAALKTSDKKPVDARKAAKIVADALNGRAPAFLLLNDLHNIARPQDLDVFATFLQELTDQTKPGVLVMFGCYATFYLGLTKSHPALSSRISRTFTLPTLTDEEAALMIAKKLLAKRLVENLDPLFPFDDEAIRVLNGAAFGNPRRLLELADTAIEHGVANRSYRIDMELARAALDNRNRAESTPPASPPPAAPAPRKPAPAAAPVARATPTRTPPAGPTASAARPNYLED
jgi:type II secretory pathway predicted ATPase ExeA